MKLKRSKVGGILVMTGTAIIGIAHVPTPKQKPSKEFIERTYIRRTGEQRWKASEERKREILENILAAKRAIRLKAETYQIDRNTRVTGITANQKLNIRSMKLMSRIADCLNSRI